MLLAAACLGGALTFAGLVLAALRSPDGASPFDPWLALTVFIPLVLVGLVRLIFLKTGGSRGWAVLAILLGLLGVVLLYYLDHSGRLVHLRTRPERTAELEVHHG